MKLHLGGGQKYLEGWTNADWTEVYKVDIKANILKQEFWNGLSPDSVTSVLCEHFIEHIPHTLPHTDQDGLIWFMEQMYRVCANGASVELSFPHYQGSWAYGDPTHCRFVQAATIEYFSRGAVLAGKFPDYGLACDFQMTGATILLVRPEGTAFTEEQLRSRVNKEWNCAYEERVFLKAIKPRRDWG